MSADKPCCCVDPKGTPKKITLPDGFQVGIFKLDDILKEVADMKLAGTKEIKEELLKKAAVHNYVPSSAETDYAIGLYQKYKQKYVESK